MILGGKDDAVAQGMFAAALRLPDQHKLIEWWDRRAGPAPRGEDIFPELPHAAAFLCANGACSSPLGSVAALKNAWANSTNPDSGFDHLGAREQVMQAAPVFAKNKTDIHE